VSCLGEAMRWPEAWPRIEMEMKLDTNRSSDAFFNVLSRSGDGVHELASKYACASPRFFRPLASRGPYRRASTGASRCISQNPHLPASICSLASMMFGVSGSDCHCPYGQAIPFLLVNMQIEGTPLSHRSGRANCLGSPRHGVDSFWSKVLQAERARTPSAGPGIIFQHGRVMITTLVPSRLFQHRIRRMPRGLLVQEAGLIRQPACGSNPP